MNRMYITKKQQKRRFDARQQAESEYKAAVTASDNADLLYDIVETDFSGFL
jgi:hypothetical protein